MPKVKSGPVTELNKPSPSLAETNADGMTVTLSELTITADLDEKNLRKARLEVDIDGFSDAPATKVPELPKEFPPLPSCDTPTEQDAKDKGTSDQWPVRDERLVRLTGRLPFNAEPPLSDLWDAGFLTPSRLFFVRNHGGVPRVSRQEAESWSITISGLVRKPLTLTLTDLQDPSQFDTVTLPVTLVCAGNRRKEQNIVRQSRFSWGAAGLSTSLFTGVYLADVLAKLDIVTEGTFGEPGFKRAEHVIFEGADELPDGRYGTSQRYKWAKNKDKGMLLAWAMNGQPLEPDHGYPLRLVVPGQIGGRSVKWLKKIEVSHVESSHHLHYWDNRLLPSSVVSEIDQRQREWWYDPRYIITDLNTNSAIAKPAHNETISFNAHGSLKTYRLAGYAYGGGGRRITRVEITLDAGQTWLLAAIIYPEDQFRQRAFKDPIWGTLDLTDREECFCWSFWHLDVPLSALEKAGSVAVKAMDESLHGQGKSMYWNATGMMNNWWFRVAIHRTVEDQNIILRFEHPTMPDNQPGWMERLKDLGQDVSDPVFTSAASTSPSVVGRPGPVLESAHAATPSPAVVMTKAGLDRKITANELEAHSGAEEPWFIVKGEIYDATPFLSKHPGGSNSITDMAGKDATESFMAIHSTAAKIQLQEFHIGTLTSSNSLAPNHPAAVQKEERRGPDEVFLQRRWKQAKLVAIEKVSHDSKIFRFELETPEQRLGLPCGNHVYVRLQRKTESQRNKAVDARKDWVQRAYTPVSSADTCGTLDLLIKIYYPSKKFPGGEMTMGFEELSIGEYVEFNGPFGDFEWLGGGMARLRGKERKAKHIGMICGGSGITPIYQVLRAIINDTADQSTQIYLLNANKTQDDILLHSELKLLAQRIRSDRFRSYYVLSDAPEGWKEGRGRITQDMLKRYMPEPDDDNLILACGPKPMIEETVKPGLTALAWNIEKSLFVF